MSVREESVCVSGEMTVGGTGEREKEIKPNVVFIQIHGTNDPFKTFSFPETGQLKITYYARNKIKSYKVYLKLPFTSIFYKHFVFAYTIVTRYVTRYIK